MENKILTGDLKKVIIDLTIPGYIGMLGMSVFNVVDTYFVAKLGTEQLAAIGFTFSVVMIVNLITIGLGIGIASLISKSVGSNDEKGKIHTVMSGLLIGLTLSLILSIGGLFTIDFLFTKLGASAEVLVYVEQYMRVWYVGAPFLFMTQISAQMFRGLGDTKTPSNTILITAAINTILDPLLIFGIWIFPEMGMTGAALATVISRVVSCILQFYLLQKKFQVIRFRKLDRTLLLERAKEIIIIGAPNSLAKVVNPVIIAFVTYVLATQSQDAVGGYAVGTKIESFILALAIAFSNTTTAVIGQNYGARYFDRVNKGIKLMEKYSFIIFAILYVLIFFLAPFLATFFTTDEDVIKIIVLYLRILPLSYAFQSIYNIITAFLNIIRKPFLASILSVLQFVLIVLPFTYLFANLFGVKGIFFAVMISYVILGFVSMYISNLQLKKLQEK